MVQSREHKPNDQLRIARESRKWSQKELADQVGVQVLTVIRWEQGVSFPAPYARRKLCQVFGQREEELGLVEEIVKETHISSSKSNSQEVNTLAQPEHMSSPPYFQTSSTLPVDQKRKKLLAKVQKFWVTGVLETSLHQSVPITMHLNEQPNAVENPWKFVFQQPEQPSHALPQNTHITDIYNNADGELLILGMPGGGKTTLLLELARALIRRAEMDEMHPIPVVFHLSSWSLHQKSLEHWLADELHDKYYIPYQLGKTWVHNDQVLPLLDGLDEVAVEHRVECMKAINSYRLERGSVPIVICCRSGEYFNLPIRALLNSAVIIQPLTYQLVDKYLLCLGEPLEALRIMLHHDAQLQELANTPLMLSILTLTYYNAPMKDAPQGNSSPKLGRQQLFEAYVEHMLIRRSVNTRYTPQQVRRWLAWLATQLNWNNQTEFYLERMQPTWLQEKQLRLLYGGRVGALFGGLIGSIFCSLLGALIGGVSTLLNNIISHGDSISIGLLGGLTIGCISGLMIGFIVGIQLNVEKIRIQPAEIITWSSEPLKKNMFQSLMIGIVGAPLLWWNVEYIYSHLFNQITRLFGGPVLGILSLLVYEIFGGLIGLGVYGLSYYLRTKVLDRKIVDHTHSKQNQRTWSFIYTGAFVGFLIGLVAIILEGKWGGPIGRLLHTILSGRPYSELVIGGVSGLLGGLIYGCIKGFSRGELDDQTRIKPNQGTHYSLRNSLLVGMIFWVLFWLIFSLVSGLTFRLIYGCVLGVIFGLLLGLANGGIAYLQHVILRWVLWQANWIPLNYPHFLDYAVERVLLRKVGGSYIFVHRLLLEYFISLHTIPTSDEDSVN